MKSASNYLAESAGALQPSRATCKGLLNDLPMVNINREEENTGLARISFHHTTTTRK